MKIKCQSLNPTEQRQFSAMGFRTKQVGDGWMCDMYDRPKFIISDSPISQGYSAESEYAAKLSAFMRWSRGS